VRYFNDRYERTGTLWDGRFRSSLVDSERYFLACSRYIENNPVRAGIVARAEEYRWSSHRCNAHGLRDVLVTPHSIYLALGDKAAARRRSYRELFATPLSEHTLHSIRQATKAQTVLGTDEFRGTLEAKLRRSLTRTGHGGDRRARRSFAIQGSA
jgi:putative transposase